MRRGLTACATAVLALGDRAYAKFCETGRLFDERFAALGATRVAERIECDLDYEAPAGTWIDGNAWHSCRPSWASRRRARSFTSISRAPAAEASRLEPDAAVRGGDHRTHPAVAAAGPRPTPGMSSCRSQGAGIEYEPGDSLGFVPVNDPALVDAVLAATGTGRQRARCVRSCSEQFDITTLTAPKFDEYAGRAVAGSCVRTAGR